MTSDQKQWVLGPDHVIIVRANQAVSDREAAPSINAHLKGPQEVVRSVSQAKIDFFILYSVCKSWCPSQFCFLPYVCQLSSEQVSPLEDCLSPSVRPLMPPLYSNKTEWEKRIHDLLFPWLCLPETYSSEPTSSQSWERVRVDVQLYLQSFTVVQAHLMHWNRLFWLLCTLRASLSVH